MTDDKRRLQICENDCVLEASVKLNGPIAKHESTKMQNANQEKKTEETFNLNGATTKWRVRVGVLCI